MWPVESLQTAGSVLLLQQPAVAAVATYVCAALTAPVNIQIKDKYTHIGQFI